MLLSLFWLLAVYINFSFVVDDGSSEITTSSYHSFSTTVVLFAPTLSLSETYSSPSLSNASGNGVICIGGFVHDLFALPPWKFLKITTIYSKIHGNIRYICTLLYSKAFLYCVNNFCKQPKNHIQYRMVLNSQAQTVTTRSRKKRYVNQHVCKNVTEIPQIRDRRDYKKGRWSKKIIIIF